MNKRELQLIAEIQDRYPCRACGGFHYPSAWMTKTREKLVTSGVLEILQCDAPPGPDHRIALRIKAA